jgi:uncharacterized MAPEG superfamily protein
MVWVDLVTLLAVIEFFVLVLLVGRAREKYGVKAPATSGNAEFERYFRVQQNTLETLIMFLPALWIAAHYWSPAWMAALGVVYLIGRVIYLRAYVQNPRGRTLGYVVSLAPVMILVGLGLFGIARAMVAG